MPSQLHVGHLAHHDGVPALAAAPDGKTLYLGSRDHRVLAWDLDPIAWRRLACRIANREMSDPEWRDAMGDVARRPTCE